MKIGYTHRKTGQVREIDSPYDNDKSAYDALLDKISKSDKVSNFERRVAEAYANFSAGRWSYLSDAKRYWLHSLTMEEESAPRHDRGIRMPLEGIKRMLSKAGEHVKSPSIRLNAEGIELKVSIAGARSRYTGDVMVASPKFGDGWYGRIAQDGKFYPGRDSTPAVRAALSRLAESPEEVAAEFGKITGRCCFCNRSLTDDRSVSVGYGPVCAERFGLSWGAN